MHGHCNHTCKINSTADSQNTQHFLFLHFESSTAFFAAIIVSLQSSLYAFPSEFQRFCTVYVFCIYIFCTISVSAHELQEAFPAIHPAFFRLHRARTILAGNTHICVKTPADFAGFPPRSSNRIRTAASRPAFFRFLPSFLKPFHAKTGEGPSKAPTGLFNCRQKFVKYRYKSKVHTTISYSPMPPEEKYRCKSKGENTPRSVTMPEMRCGGVRSNAG